MARRLVSLTQARRGFGFIDIQPDGSVQLNPDVGVLSVDGSFPIKGPSPLIDVTHPTWGAVPGATDSTTAIDNAVAAIHASGGGIVLIPGGKGTFTYTPDNLTWYSDVVILDLSGSTPAPTNGALQPYTSQQVRISDGNNHQLSGQLLSVTGGTTGDNVAGYFDVNRTGGTANVWAINTVTRFTTDGEAFGIEIDYDDDYADGGRGTNEYSALYIQNEGAYAGSAGITIVRNTNSTKRFRDGIWLDDPGDLSCLAAQGDTYVNTTSTTTVSAPGSVVITPNSMTNITTGKQLVVEWDDSHAETVVVTATTSTTFTATFTQTHNAGFKIHSCPLDGINLVNVYDHGIVLRANAGTMIAWRTTDQTAPDLGTIASDVNGNLNLSTAFNALKTNGQQHAVSQYTANQTLGTTNEYIHGNASAGAINFSLPAASTGKIRYVIKKVDSSANAVTITPNGSDTIEGAANISIGTQYGTYVIYSDGSSTWFIESSH